LTFVNVISLPFYLRLTAAIGAAIGDEDFRLCHSLSGCIRTGVRSTLVRMEAARVLSYDTFIADQSVNHLLAADADDQFAAVIESWNAIAFDPTVVDTWLPWQARQGLIALERLSRSIASVQAVLVGRLDAGRDTTASLVRTTGMSQRLARELHAASKIIEQHPNALNMLSSGEVSTEHLAQLGHVDTELAAQLLVDAETKSADELKKMSTNNEPATMRQH
jgi:hypothetical protein